MGVTTIEWTDATWNPVRGCTKISPGCKHCYASTFAERFRGVHGHAYEHGFDLRLIPSKLDEPFVWTKPSLVFVNSMSDLFHPEIPDEYIVRVAKTMQSADWHTYQVLTKRADRLRSLLATKLRFAASLKHIWWGVSVEDKKYGVPRIEELRSSTAAVKFLSVEPLLEDLGHLDLTYIDWMIVGGESGAKSRLMKADWVRSLRDQCHRSGTHFFFKQWGGVRKKQNGRQLDGRFYDAMPGVLTKKMPSRSERMQMAAQQQPFTILKSICEPNEATQSGSPLYS